MKVEREDSPGAPIAKETPGKTTKQKPGVTRPIFLRAALGGGGPGVPQRRKAARGGTPRARGNDLSPAPPVEAWGPGGPRGPPSVAVEDPGPRPLGPARWRDEDCRTPAGRAERRAASKKLAAAQRRTLAAALIRRGQGSGHENQPIFSRIQRRPGEGAHRSRPSRRSPSHQRFREGR